MFPQEALRMMFLGNGGCRALRWRMLCKGGDDGPPPPAGTTPNLGVESVCACGRVCRGARCRAFVSLTTGRFASLAIERSLHSLQNASL